MASGLPVVVSDISELTDLVADGRNGLVVGVDDPDALTRALRVLLDDPDLRARLGRAGREFVEDRAGDPTPRLARFYEAIVEREAITA